MWDFLGATPHPPSCPLNIPASPCGPLNRLLTGLVGLVLLCPKGFANFVLVGVKTHAIDSAANTLTLGMTWASTIANRKAKDRHWTINQQPYLTDSNSIQHQIEILPSSTLMSSYAAALVILYFVWSTKVFTLLVDQKTYAEKTVARPLSGFEPAPQSSHVNADFEPEAL